MTDSWEGDYKKLTEIQNIKTEIEDIKAEVGKLRSDCRKLSKQIEMRGFQDQLNSLHDSLLKTKQSLALVTIFAYSMYLNIWVGKELSDSTSPTFIQAAKFVQTKGEKAHDKAKKSSDPTSVVSQFMTDCAEYFRIHDLEPFRDHKIL
jgi:septal ring factor EnvC (AmiA/AmiB activator)